jgi:hypothetical protein
MASTMALILLASSLVVVLPLVWLERRLTMLHGG